MDVSKPQLPGPLLRSLQIAEVLKLRCVAMCCDVLRCAAMCCDVLRCVTVFAHGVPSPETSTGGVAQNDEAQIPRSVPK